MPFIKQKLGIDLGTTNILVFKPHKGIIINEPSLVAVSIADNKIFEIGAAAKDMIGRTPETIAVARPLKNGVIANYKVTSAMLRYFIRKAVGKFHIFKPDVLISTPAGITSTERRAVYEAAIHAGAREVFIIKEPILSAIGAKVPINSARGQMILNIGGGTTEIAVISLGGIVSWESIKMGGNKLDEAIIDYVKQEHNLAIGERTAEAIKIAIGSAVKQKDEDKISVRGRDITTGYPRTIDLSSNEITEAIQENLKEVAQVIQEVLRKTPPELCSDVIEQGITIAGGGALLKNIDVLITKITSVPSRIAETPLLCVVKGTGVVLDNLDIYKRNVMARR